MRDRAIPEERRGESLSLAQDADGAVQLASQKRYGNVARDARRRGAGRF